MGKEYSPQVQTWLKSIADGCGKEDIAIRERQLRKWRRLKLFWENFTQVWYSEVAHDWRIWDNEQAAGNNDQEYYDKQMNVFRAYLESIIAALSVTVPPVKCYPDDAEDTLDLATARTGDKIAQLIYRHNDVPLLWLHSLFIYCTEGAMFYYNYTKQDSKYGTYKENKYTDTVENHEYTVCSQCGFQMDDRIMGEDEELKNTEFNEFMPDEGDVAIRAILGNSPEKDLCPSCMQMMDPELKQESFTVTRLVGETEQAKSRVCLEAYGGLNVKVSNFARKQEECMYLIYAFEGDYTKAMDKYEGIRGNDKIAKEMAKTTSSPGGYDQYEQWARLSPQYQGAYPENVVTTKQCWIRPERFHILGNEDAFDELKKLFPFGVKVTLVNDEYACAEPEAMDDCWTLIYNPLSDFVYFDPLGMLLTSVQEITNDIISLTLQTMEHGVGQTFADPKVLNFKAYEQTEVTPGGVFPATAASGKTLADGFHEMKTATLSAEVMPFANQIQSLGQLCSAAQPSIFGGQLQGSETASEYSMSRSQALQRLQNVWKMLTMGWKNVFGKAIPMYIKIVQEDERDVQRTKDGNFINTFIRKAELEGKIGKIELEANENLPMTWGQIRDTVMQLLNGGNPEILAILGAPENLPFIREAIGLTDFYVPGEDEIEATYDDIKALLNSEPIEMPPDPMMEQQAMMAGMPPPPPMEQPAIQPDPDVDTPELRFRILKGWLQSEAGRMAKVDNQMGYKNVLLYAKSYKMMMMPPPGMLGPGPEGNGAAPPEKPNKSKTAPIKGEGDVKTVA